MTSCVLPSVGNMPLIKQFGMRSFGLLLVLAEVVMGQSCPDLSPGSNMVLSSTTGVVGGTSVMVSCDAGYKLNTGVLEKYLQCDTGAAWNDTVGTCELKQCPSITTYLTPFMTSAGIPSVNYFGDEVVVDCIYGYAFDVDLSEPIGSRVTQNATAHCDDNPSSIEGIWSMSDTCSLIDCGSPPNIKDSVQIVSGMTYGSTAVYQCVSGYANTVYGDLYSATALCNGTAAWETDMSKNGSATGLTCVGLNNYKGCADMSCRATVNESLFHGDTVDTCVDFCYGNRHRYAALTNGTCFCLEELNETLCPMESDLFCNGTCGSYDPNVTDSTVPVFCGGPNNFASIYLAFDGIYYSVTLGHVYGEKVYDKHYATCRERCRSNETKLAALDGDMCYCINITDVDGQKLIYNGTYYPGDLRIFDTSKDPVKADSCYSLFQNGVKQAGLYYLAEPIRKEWCDFLDGTVCEPGWVGYQNSCYISHPDVAMDFHTAREYCRVNNSAELVTILSDEEKDFLNLYQSKFDNIYAIKYAGIPPCWWLGMIDNRQSSLFLWLDGNIMTYTDFEEGRPNNKNISCAAGIFGHWHEDECSLEQNVMCKKEAEWSDCFLVTSGAAAIMQHTSDQMTVTLCIEVCKGQNALYVLLRNDTCQCLDSPLIGSPRPLSDCSTPCPGHSYQYCGGTGAVGTYLKLEGRNLASSCDDLQMIGLEANTYKLNISNTPTIENCPDPVCPFSWHSVDDHCYKAHLATKNMQLAVEDCATSDAYVASIETEDEIEDLYEKLERYDINNPVTRWRVGLYALHMNSGLYKWSNGRTLDPEIWNNSVVEHNLRGPSVVVTTGSSNYTWKAVKSFSDTYICEKGKDFVGCYTDPVMTVGAGIDEYSHMTIELCVEKCRAAPAQYAYVSETVCKCSDTLTTAVPGKCNTVCSGQLNQVCGGRNSYMSVYNISMYPPLGINDCSDLYTAGITLSGSYMVVDSPTYCNFIDATICDHGWIGFEDNCYVYVYPMNEVSNADLCRNQNATLTSLTSRGEYEALATYVERTRLPMEGRPLTGITDGGYDLDVYISADGLLVSKELVNSEELSPLDLHDEYGYISFRLDKSVSLDLGGAMCKKEKYLLGCYNMIPAVVPVLDGYNSVELTLCRQLCEFSGHNVTIIGNNFCACSSVPDMTSFTETNGSACDVPCSIHTDQYCGDGTVFWAHLTGRRDLANNCTDLYRSGIFYNTMYYLEDPDNVGTMEAVNCGFSDTTDCPPTWLGYDGECYRFNIQPTDYKGAVPKCMMYGGYLFNPLDASQPSIYDDFITKSDLFPGLSHWLAGIFPVLYNATYVTSDGSLVSPNVDLSNITNKPLTTSAYDVDTKTWFEPTENLPFVCQRNNDFLGCHDIVSVPDAQYESLRNSLTMCIQWCHGVNMQYAATHVGKCSCFAGYPVTVPSSGNCSEPCVGVASQPCGGQLEDGTKLYTLRQIANDTAVVPTCMDLLYYGVMQPGVYYVQYDVMYPRVNVSCFLNAGPYATLMPNVIMDITGSSAMSGYGFTNLGLTFPITDVWRPSNNDGAQFVKHVLFGDHIVTGVITTGLLVPSGLSYVYNYTLLYRDTVSGQMVTFVQNGSSELLPQCDDILGVCVMFLSRPFVTNEVHLQPNAWQRSIAMKMAIFGQDITTFEPYNRYLGCFLDYGPGFATGDTSGNLDVCVALCKDNSYPFASIGENGECICKSRGVENGQMHDGKCVFNATGQYAVSQNNSWALYRAYDAYCPDPDLTQLPNGNGTSAHFPYVENVFNFGSSVNFTCDEGYEFTDNSETDTIYCLQDNTWTNVTKTCQIISCPAFPMVVGGYVNVTNVTYLSVATVTCDVGLYTESTQQVMDVRCESNKEWTIIPTCTVHNRHSHQFYYHISADTVRTTSNLLEEVTSRSRADCASHCSENYYCKGANYQQPPDPSSQIGTCRLFSADHVGGDLSSEPGWIYLEP